MLALQQPFSIPFGSVIAALMHGELGAADEIVPFAVIIIVLFVVWFYARRRTDDEDELEEPEDFRSDG